MSQETRKNRIAVVGATGFVGRKLIEYLLDREDLKILALSRSPLREEKILNHENFSWSSVDLHDLDSIEDALKDVDAAYYLVHSMLPSARSIEGSFSDLDLSLADNFGRAAKKCSLKQVIYLSGIISDPDDISEHLRSRLEVERALAAYIPNLTTVRTGLIIGEGGSSFTIVYRLVKRLPMMICPRWTQRLSQPIFIDDVLAALAYCLLRPEHYSKVYDLGADEKITYVELMRRTGQLLGRMPFLLVVPVFTPKLSRLWVSVVTGAPKNLVYPLIDSLRENMVVDPEKALRVPGLQFKTINETLAIVLERYRQLRQRKNLEAPYAFKRFLTPKKRRVRSIQRLYLPETKDAAWVAREYMLWLPSLFSWLLRVKVDGSRLSFELRLVRKDLLILRHAPEDSGKDRQLFRVEGGLLVSREDENGRLELRETLGGKAVIAAIHDFVPSLPWYLYRFTHAAIHIAVMRRFDMHLKAMASDRY